MAEAHSSAGSLFSQSLSLSIHSRTYAGQFSSFMHPPRNLSSLALLVAPGYSFCSFLGLMESGTMLTVCVPPGGFRIIQWTTPKTFLPWCSNSSPKGTLLLPLLAAAINCCSILARRSLTSEVSSCADKDVITATIDFLSQTGALR
jgi:hypothetical protein